MAEQKSDDSTVAGILAPLNDIPYDDEFVDQLQPWVAAIAGLEGSLVRPKWQFGDVPNMPGFETNWIGLGIPRWRQDVFPAVQHDPAAQASDVMGRTEEHDLLVSCYGPTSAALAARVRDGCQLEQNRVPLHALNVDVIEVTDIVKVPVLVNAQWQKRHNVTVRVRRYVERRYAVRSVAKLPTAPVDAQSFIDNEQYRTPIIVEQE